MLIIPCPFCGERSFTEFTYGGDSSRPFPGLENSDPAAWTDFLIFRDNPKGLHTELWQHQHGCRQWLRVVRHTVTHVIESVTPAIEAGDE